MTNETQIQYVKKYLLENGRIDRNMCLRQRITRLGAIIFTLKKKPYNYKIKGEWVKENGGRNFYYYLTEQPYKPKVQVVERNGVPVAIMM